MNAKLVGRTISVLLIIVSLFMLTPVVVALAYKEYDTIVAFVVPSLATIAVGSVGALLVRHPESELTTRDGFFLVTFGWISATVIGSLPAVISGAIPRFVDAFFETMSGFTTTGASILTDIENLPKSILFWRSLTHWLGGMGIIVLTVAVFPLLGIGGAHLVNAEAPGPTVDKVTPNIKQTAKILWLTYIILSLAETVLLLFGGMNLFDALTHTFGTVATGGFSPLNTSVGQFDSAYIDIVIIVFMILAGVNFILYFKTISGRLREVLRDGELRAYLGIFVGATVIAALSLRGVRFAGFGESLRCAAFQTASIMTTTGYATDDFAAWPALAQHVLLGLMFVGGCTGSTGGGIKVGRIVVLMKQGLLEMRKQIHPYRKFIVRLNDKPIGDSLISKISGFAFLYIVVIVATTLIVGASGSDLLTSFSTALATLGNIGPGFGLVGPTQNYAFFPDWVTWYLSLVMLGGRLELYTVLIIFTRRFWSR